MRYIFVVFLASSIALTAHADVSENVPQGREKLCSNALNACLDLSKQQDVSIASLKKEVSNLQNRLVDEQNAVQGSKFVYFILGMVATGVVVYTVRK